MTRAPAVSFIVRVWDDGSGPEVRGEIEHIGTGEKRFFMDYTAMQKLIDGWRRELQAAT